METCLTSLLTRVTHRARTWTGWKTCKRKKKKSSPEPVQIFPCQCVSQSPCLNKYPLFNTISQLHSLNFSFYSHFFTLSVMKVISKWFFFWSTFKCSHNEDISQLLTGFKSTVKILFLFFARWNTCIVCLGWSHERSTLRHFGVVSQRHNNQQ